MWRQSLKLKWIIAKTVEEEKNKKKERIWEIESAKQNRQKNPNISVITIKD